MTLSEMRDILTSRNIQLTKSLGQNFLHDGNQLRRIVEAADLHPGQRVLEIGPGLGPLTELILAKGVQVVAVEKDSRLVEVLEERFHGRDKLVLLHADALEELEDVSKDWSAWKLVSNLPYSVASPILVELAMSPGCPLVMVVTLQLEVAQRIMSKAGDDAYGILSLLLQLRYQAASSFKIPASCFFPAPDVDSACVVLVRRDHHLLRPGPPTKIFAQIVKQGFSQRRKMMLKLLRERWPDLPWEEFFAELAINPMARAEEVSLEKFVELTKKVSS
jgi:16S rRNA (adenine1518-N6/adenine1519-N6)-dimethyltransferase